MADPRIPTFLQDQSLPESHTPAQTLSSEAVLDALKMILLGASLNDVLTSIIRLIEAHSEGTLCSISLLSEDGSHLRCAAAPSLPEPYRAASDRLAIGPAAGSCGTAAYLRQPVFVSDIASDPKWAKFSDFALQNGLHAAWSSPIMSHDGKVLGTFGMHYREGRYPGPSEVKLIDYASHVAGIAIERYQSQLERTIAFEKLAKSEAERRQIIDAISQLIMVLHPDGTPVSRTLGREVNRHLALRMSLALDMTRRTGRIAGLYILNDGKFRSA